MPNLYRPTPVLHSLALSAHTGKPVYLKMECWHAAGSFKIRGIGALCEHFAARGSQRLISSSGGNAGYAVAFSAQRLAVPATIVVPETTAPEVRARMRELGAEVIAHGVVWDTAHAYALSLAAERGGDYVHPFDDPIVWRGNASMIHELAQDLPRAPEVIVVAVGGGGLFCGVMQGLREVGWHGTRVIAAETEGAASLAAALSAQALVELPAITSIATTLGARKVAAQAFAYARESKVRSVVVSDRAAVEACLRFADDQRALVEPACGAALAVLYGKHAALAQADDIAVIVCGGIGVTHAKLIEWQRILPTA